MFRVVRAPALLLAALSLAWNGTAFAGDPIELRVFVFDEAGPVPQIDVFLDGNKLGSTAEEGLVEANPEAGTHVVALRQGAASLGTLEVATAPGAAVQVIATLPATPSGETSFDVEGAQSGSYAAAATTVMAATGELAGKVISADTREPVGGAQVYFSGLALKVTTNDHGRFRARLAAGTYQVSVVHPNFSTQTLDDVRVLADETASIEIEVSPAGLLLNDYTVTAPHIEGSVAAVFSDQREGSGVSEVLGAEQMSRSGDSSAADALKRVTGLTIEDGKYVVIRGQPSRYTLTLWNGSPLPSPDPIRRIVPLDLFPTGMLSKVEVEKSYDAEAPGSFGGGMIRLETTGVPEENFLQLSVKAGANSITTGKTGLTYAGGNQDWLGKDDGTRDLPPGMAPNLSAKKVERAARGFSNNWAVTDEKYGLEPGVGAALGGRKRLFGGTFGIMAAGNWDQGYQYTETIKRDYGLGNDGRLVRRNDQTERRSDTEVNLGGLVVGAAEWERHKFRSNTFYMRKAVKRAEIAEGIRLVSDDLYIRDYLLDWSERDLFAQQVIGEHKLDWLAIDWRGMLADSSAYSPDRRSYIYRRQDDGSYVFFNQAKATRQYSQNQDDIKSFDTDLAVPVLERKAWKLKLHGGMSFYTQDRISATRRFSFETKDEPDLAQEPEVLFDPARLGSTLLVKDQTQTNDNYLGSVFVRGLYLKADNDWFERLRGTFGLRQEYADFHVETFVAGGSRGGQKVEAGFQNTDLLPFAALTWRFIDKMQARVSAARTLSRPVLNELSPARYYDPDSGEEYLGNPKLQPAVIDALDMRWEWYPTGRETVSVGVFTKNYTDPIEQSFVGVGGSSYLRQIQNAAGAKVRGLELSARADLSRFVAPLGAAGDWSDRAYAQANAAFARSEVELARKDLATSAKRPLQGQANNVYNLQLGYDGDDHDFDLSYNRVGRRLFLAGVQGQPDVYQQPFALLDFNYTYALTKQLKLKTKLGNLLDPRFEYLQGDELYRSYRKGIDASLGLTFTL